MKKLVIPVLLSFLALLSGCGEETFNGNVNKNLAPSKGTALQWTQGTINGGGGVGLRCNGRLELVDVYEARQKGLRLIDAPENEEQAVDLLARRLAEHFWNPSTIEIEQYVEFLAQGIVRPIFQSQDFKNPGTGKMEKVRFVDSLPPSYDLGDYDIPDECQLEQVAYFSDQQTDLAIVRSAWKELDWLSRTFLVGHELSYMIYRRDGIKGLKFQERLYTSEMARHFVGLLLSTTPSPPRSNDLDQTTNLKACGNIPEDEEKGITYFYAYRDTSNDQMHFVFNALLGHSSLYQMKATFHGLRQGQTTAAAVQGDKEISLQLVGSRPKDDPGIFVIVENTSNGRWILRTRYEQSRGEWEEIEQTISCRDYQYPR